jgi:small-conductance mechanosensitive channel
VVALVFAFSLVAGAQEPMVQDTPQAAPEPVGADRAARDETIRTELQAVFDRVPGLNGVDVTVDAGVVRLVGTVVSTDTRRRAVALADSMTGVLYVDDRIRTSSSLDEQLQPTWDRLRDLGYGALAKLPLLAVALLVVGLAGGLGTVVARWSGPAFLGTRNPFLQNLVRRFLQWVLIIIGVVVALDLLQATALVGAIVGTAGLAGLAVGFAFKDIVENYLAGTILAIRQPFAKNDQILVAGYEAKVVRLTPRETILMTLDGNHVRLPNALIFASPMVNFTRNPFRRFEFDLGVGSADDLALTRQVCTNTLSGMAGVLRDPAPDALVMAIGDSTVTVRCLAWIDQRKTEYARVRGEAIRLVKAHLEAGGITLPSPEYLVRMQSDAQPAPAGSGQPVAPSPATQDDVSVDLAVDRQIERERRTSDEEDLLAQDGSHNESA